MANFLLIFIVSFLNVLNLGSTDTYYSSKIDQKDINGIWMGTVKLSENLGVRMAFIIKVSDSDSLSATFNIIEQKALNIPVDKLEFSDGKLFLEISKLGISYRGIFNTEKKTFEGSYFQGDKSFSLILNKVDKLPGKISRLQTPQRPFPYVEKNVTYENIIAGVKLAGTLTLPEGPGPFPAVILIAGSGKNDRNETPFGHFLLLSDYLTKRGFAVLRADKRGVGESTGNYRSATSMDFAQDIEAGINFLKTIPEINSEKIGLIGHSEGAVIAPIIASRNDKVAFIVMMGGVGISGEQLLYIQAEKIARLNGADDEGIKAQTAQQKQFYPIAKMDMREEDLILKLKAVDNNISQKMIEFLINPWFRSFLSLNAYDYLKKVKCPALALTGEKDVQCPADPNLIQIEKALIEAHNKDYKIMTIPELNHLFQTSKSGSPLEYESIEEIIAPVALKEIGDWITSKISNNNEVYFIPTIHGYHKINKNYSYDSLRTIIAKINPDIIATEIREEDINEDTLYLKKNYPFEMYMMRYWFPKSKIVGFDWLGEDIEGKLIDKDYWTKSSKIKKLEKKLSQDSLYTKIISEFMPRLEERESLLISLSLKNLLKSKDAEIAIQYHNYLKEKLYGTPYEGVEGFNIKRNQKILERINDIINKNKSKRIVIITGGDHFADLKDKFPYINIEDKL